MRFSVECGIPKGLRLLLRSADASAWHGYQLEEPYALIGTADRCNVRVSDKNIAPFHAYLQMLDNRLFVCDLTEKGGVLVDQSPVTAEWVDQASSIHVGPYQLRIAAIETVGQHPSGSAAGSGDRQSNLPSIRPRNSVVLSMRGGNGRNRQARSSRDVSLVGRSAACKFQLRSPAISNFHCSLIRTSESLWVVDLGSRRGTFLDGTRVKQARVTSGSQLHVGRILMNVDIDPAETADEDEPSVRHSFEDSTRNLIHPAAGASGGYSEELIRDLVADVASSQQAAFEQARELLVEVLRNQQESHTEQLLSLKDQNAQLLEVIRMLAPSRDVLPATARLPEPQPAAPVSEVAPVQPAAPVQGVAAEKNTPEPAAGPTRTSVANEKPRHMPPPQDPEVHEAWVRSQLHTISESLKKEQERGVRKLLRRLLPGNKSDDALR